MTIKHIEMYQFSLRATGVGIRTLIHCMVDYKAILSYLSEHNLHHFTFYPKCEKPVRAIIRQ